MGVQVAFNATAFQELFPQFATISADQLNQVILPVATMYHRNDGGGPVNSAADQLQLLNLMVAHVCQLFYGPNGNNPSGIVGRITQATKGTITVQTEYFPMTATSAWFQQTPFGAAYWQATATYRTARFVRARGYNVVNPWQLPEPGVF